ncbi:carboxymuconolactone decarboxylase family protein [bacterium]|nr:carboxymuconolactone decarboxylase family protein [bacterium]
MNVIRTFDKELADDYLAFEEALFQDGALSKKFKILMAMALDAIKSAAGGVRSYTLKALDAGATWDEIKESLRVAYYIGHAGPLWTAIHGLDDVVIKK